MHCRSPVTPPMPSPSEGSLSLNPLRRRCVASDLSCSFVTESRFPRDPHNANIIEPFRLGQNSNAVPTEADSLYSEPKEQNPPSLTTQASPSGHRAPLLSVSSHETPEDPVSTRIPRTSTKRFERPNYLHVIAHVVVCCVAYPIIYAGTVLARDRSLFWARVIVGLWCAGVGVVIGWSLVAFATKYTEAASKHASHFFRTSWVPNSVLIRSWKHGQL